MDVSFLGMTDVSEDGKIINNNVRKYAEVSKGYTPFRDGDILVAKITPCFENGKGALVHSLVNGIGFGSTEFHVLRPSEQIDPYLLLNITQSKPFRVLGESEMSGSAGQKRVPSAFIADYEIPLPPLPEQRKIAAIIRTWDEAIEKTESLIKANEKRLFLLTTSLIFGRIRLGKRPTHERAQHKWVSGPKDWKLQQIGDIAVERSELNTGGATLTVLSCSKHDGFVRSLDYFKKQIFSKNLAGYKTIYRGDFGFPSNHVEEGSIGLQNLEDKALVSPIYIVFTPDEKRIHADFLFRLLKTKTYAHIFRASTSSSVDRRGNLRWAEFSSIPVCLPDLKEQQEISAFLKGQQNLIDDLYRYKHALQSQKRGLMQKLLTGEWRVQVDKEAA
jgi:type I restriction enzyme S subunit